MPDMVNEYKIECYRKIMPLCSKGNLWVVEDSVSKKRFVMRKLSMDSEPVYQKLANIHHANIIEIEDVFSHNGYLYVIEEYLEWKLLSDTIHSERQSHRRVFSIGKQLFRALLVLQEHHIVHRDIKPENIMIDALGNVKLIDFDIARLYTEGKNSDTTIKGSRDYAPPEQFGFSQTDQRTDIYSLGVTLNELAIGKLPEEKRCTGKLGIIIRRCIEFDPKRRYQSAEQALKHMEWLEKRTMLFLVSAAALALLLLICQVVLIRPEKYEEETAFSSTEYPDRIIFVQEEAADLYPAFSMTENQEFICTANLGDNVTVNISAKKDNERLGLTLTLADGNTTDFTFDDVFQDVYMQQGYYIHTDMERPSPEYEILLDDINEDGITDLLLTLAWRCRIDTSNPESRYYLTEYSTLWVVYMTKDHEFVCSEPLYFEGCLPELESDAIIFNNMTNEWFTFQNGIWYGY